MTTLLFPVKMPSSKNATKCFYKNIEVNVVPSAFSPVSTWQRLATISGDPLMKAKAEPPPTDTVTTLILWRAEEKGNLCTMATGSLEDWWHDGQKKEQDVHDLRT